MTVGTLVLCPNIADKLLNLVPPLALRIIFPPYIFTLVIWDTVEILKNICKSHVCRLDGLFEHLALLFCDYITTQDDSH